MASYDEFLKVVRGDLRIDRQHKRVRLDGCDRDDVFQRIERHLGEEMGIDGEQVVGADQQAVAVRRGMRDQFAGDIAAGAGLVFDHDRLAEPDGPAACRQCDLRKIGWVEAIRTKCFQIQATISATGRHV